MNSNDILIDTSIIIELPSGNTVFFQGIEELPKTSNENKIKFQKNRNAIINQDILFKPFIYDFSSHFLILVIYNETKEQIEIHDFKKIQYKSFEEGEFYSPIWTYKIKIDKLISVKIIENDEYPIICLNSTESIKLLEIKTGKEYKTINLIDGYNVITKWSKARPNEIVNLSSNRCLFTFNFEKNDCKIIGSNVSSFIITSEGKILFISEDKLYSCDKRNKIFFVRQIMSKNNINIINVFQDKAFIVSKSESNSYIFSLFNYKTNEIRSCSFAEVGNGLIDNQMNISSSIYHSIVVIGIPEYEKFIYLNCESLDKFEQIIFEKENEIKIPLNEDFEYDKINGIQFINTNVDEFAHFPSLISFFGNDKIIIYNIIPQLKDFDEPWPFSLIDPMNKILSFDCIKTINAVENEKQFFEKPTRSFFGKNMFQNNSSFSFSNNSPISRNSSLGHSRLSTQSKQSDQKKETVTRSKFGK